MIEEIEELSDEELEKQITTALNWRDKVEELQAETMRRVEAKRTYVKIVCPVCEGTKHVPQRHGGDPLDTKCNKCEGKGYIKGYLKE